MLQRSRATAGGTPMIDFIGMDMPPPNKAPMTGAHIFNPNDNLDYDAEEFKNGLACVLAEVPENLFSQKKIVSMSTTTGHKTLGSDYIKFVEHGVEIKRLPAVGEKAYREAASTYFGINL